MFHTDLKGHLLLNKQLFCALPCYLADSADVSFDEFSHVIDKHLLYGISVWSGTGECPVDSRALVVC